VNKLIYLSFLILGLLLVLFFIIKGDSKPTMKIEICENITSGKLKVVCYSLFLKNYESCKLAADFSTYCYDSVLPLMELNESFCESQDYAYVKLSCFKHLAIQKKDYTFCDSLKDQVVIDICYANLFDYIDYFKESGLCENISHESTKFACLAKLERNVTKCYDIVSEVNERNICLGMLTMNVSDCTAQSPDANSLITLSSCVTNIASEMKNMSICDNIEYQEARWKCKVPLAKSMDICNDADGPWKDFCKIEYIKNNLI
jgi:hypothetical protein